MEGRKREAKQSAKRIYSTPQLTAHGSVEVITKTQVKGGVRGDGGTMSRL